jgi:2-polyprenyl-6-methoxyphenol hydroxylase-like FAD-dependent oxidoreductase
MSASRHRPVLIAGGGIGGLAAALALARRGVAAHVLEAEAHVSESGAGIQIGPNGSRILRAFGLGDALAAEAGRPLGILLRDGPSGKTLAEIPLGAEAERRYGAPYHVVERRVLHRILLDGARCRAEIGLTSGFRLAGLRQAQGDMVAVSADGREVEGVALVGADGVHSETRSLLFGATPAFSGYNAWRATAPLSALEQADTGYVSLWLGPNAHLVHYACGPRGPLNAVTITSGRPASPGWGTAGDGAELMQAFDGWSAEARAILSAFGDWMIWPLLAMPPLPRWSDHRAVLLGDAAHPLMPFLASGAVMALEDAAVLAAEIARAPQDLPEAFRAYQRRRQERVVNVQRTSRRMGEIYHMSGALRLARNLALAAMPGRRLLARNDWLYGYCAGADDVLGAAAPGAGAPGAG